MVVRGWSEMTAPPNDSSEVGYELALTNALIRQLTTEQINGENGWINLLQGTFNYGNKLVWNGKELTLNGKVIATSGRIGGFTIEDDALVNEEYIEISPYTSAYSGGRIKVSDSYGRYVNIAPHEIRLSNADKTVQSYIEPGSAHITGNVYAGSSRTNYNFIENGVALYEKYMGIVTDGTYYGMRIGNSDSAWIRTTSLGLIPYQAGGASSLGTSGWPFNSIYGKTIYENGTALSNKYAPKSGSDIRLKENVDECEVDSALEVIDRIQLHSFDWRKNGKHQQIGFVADELEEIDEHLADGGGYDADGEMIVKSVDTFYLQGYEIKAIQELHAEVRSLKAEIAELKEIIAVLMEGKK